MTAYDEVIYPGRAYPDTHPEHLATLATLFAMTPVPVERCRVLEVACGDGGNLIPMAYGLPGSEFVGFDLAARPIALGKTTAARLGLSNVSLSQFDLADFPRAAGQFDYIIAHGLYSWIPAPVRDSLLALIVSHLAPQGVAFVSYNTYPGCYMRRMVWEILHFHTDHIGDSRQRIEEAKALAGLLARARTAQDGYGAFLTATLEGLPERDAAYFFHDDLASINEPVYFHEFIEHARRHNLQFLGESELRSMGYGGLTAEAKGVLDALDALTREQYLDFVRFRRFRQTLLCHADVRLRRQPGSDRIEDFLLAAPAGMRVRVTESQPVEKGAGKQAPGTPADERLLQAILDVLQERAPRLLEFGELTALVRQGPQAAALHERGPDIFRELAFGAARAGALDLHVRAPGFTVEPGERPLASPVARLQLEHGPLVTSLWHDSVNLDDEIGARLLALLDGTRGRSELVDAMGGLLEGDELPARMRALERHLELLGKLALLVA
jgi:SAM-dependent methyltransferase